MEDTARFLRLWLRTAFPTRYAIAQLATLVLGCIPLLGLLTGSPITGPGLGRILLLFLLGSIGLFFVRMILTPKLILERKLAELAEAQRAEHQLRDRESSEIESKLMDDLRNLKAQQDATHKDYRALKEQWDEREKRRQWIDKLAKFVVEAHDMIQERDDAGPRRDPHFDRKIQMWCRRVYNYLANHMGNYYGNQFKGDGERAERFEDIAPKDIPKLTRKLQDMHAQLLRDQK